MASPGRVLLAGLIPGARLKIYPDAVHGFLFQRHAEVAANVDAFLPAHERNRARDQADRTRGTRLRSRQPSTRAVTRLSTAGS
jgi:hypothetical protein